MCFDLDSHPPIAPIAGGALDLGALILTAADRNWFAAFRARAAEPTGAGVVILPDVRGLHPYYEELALRFAEHGIDALAIDWFGRTAGRRAARRGVRLHAPRRADDLGRDLGRHRRRGRGAAGARRGPAGPDRRLHDRLLHGRPDVVPRRDARARPGGRHRPVRDARRSVAQRRARAGRRRDVAVQGARSSVSSAAPTRSSRRTRSPRSMPGSRRPASTTASSPIRAPRTASSTARRPSSRTPAPRPGTRCSGSSASGRPSRRRPGPVRDARPPGAVAAFSQDERAAMMVMPGSRPACSAVHVRMSAGQTGLDAGERRVQADAGRGGRPVARSGSADDPGAGVARRDDQDPARQVRVRRRGEERGLDPGDPGHRVGEGQDRRARRPTGTRRARPASRAAATIRGSCG